MILRSLRDVSSKLLKTATAAGVELPEFAADYTEILEHYARDDVLTLAFTPGIATAEEYYRRLSSRLEGGGAVATHHHLLLKTQRAEVEEAARNGVVKTIFTPRDAEPGYRHRACQKGCPPRSPQGGEGV
jgi:Lhr-like helicase